MRKRRETLKNPEHELRIFRTRAVLAALVILILTGVLAGRLAYLQIIQHEAFSTRSEKNRVRVEPLPPNRGLIYDRNGVLLAENRPTYNLTLIRDRKSTRLNSSHVAISYAVFCLKKKYRTTRLRLRWVISVRLHMR